LEPGDPQAWVSLCEAISRESNNKNGGIEKMEKEEFEKLLKEIVETQLKPIREDLAALKQPLKATLPENEGKSVADVAKLMEAEWDTEYINNLPDSAFATIGAGGEKDAEGKTVPRTLRHLPYKNAQGNIDLPHLRNALARLNQIESGSQAEAKKKLCAAAKEVGLESEVCGLTESAYLVEARKEIVDLKAKVADVEKQLNDANSKYASLKEAVNNIIQNAEMRYFNPGAVAVLNKIQKTLRSS
jgi:hypothetical protein